MATSIQYGLPPVCTIASPVGPVLLSRAKTQTTSTTPILRTTVSLNLCIHHYFSGASSTRPISRIPPKSSIPPPQTYIYPDPIPEFAQSETKKFRTELFKKLSKDKETFGDDLDQVVDVCSQIFSDFLHDEYGGPGTLLVEPFTYMLVALKDKKLPGAPLAARAALLWAQNYVDQDWEIWNSKIPN